MFFECSSIQSLPDLSKLNTSNVEYMSEMFGRYKKLSSVSYISFWDISKVINMWNVFYDWKKFIIPMKFRDCIIY